MSGLDKYKIPDQVRLQLAETDLIFLVCLPTRWNKAYTREWQDYLSETATIDSEGKATLGKVNPGVMIEHQRIAFVNHCILEYPDEVTPEMLLGDYYPAMESLFAVAQQLATEEEARADALSKKLSTSSTGKPNGEAKSASIKSLKKPEESPNAIGSQIPQVQIG